LSRKGRGVKSWTIWTTAENLTKIDLLPGPNLDRLDRQVTSSFWKDPDEFRTWHPGHRQLTCSPTRLGQSPSQIRRGICSVAATGIGDPGGACRADAAFLRLIRVRIFARICQVGSCLNVCILSSPSKNLRNFYIRHLYEPWFPLTSVLLHL
jgi:hypothetical protein